MLYTKRSILLKAKKHNTVFATLVRRLARRPNFEFQVWSSPDSDDLAFLRVSLSLDDRAQSSVSPLKLRFLCQELTMDLAASFSQHGRGLVD